MNLSVWLSLPGTFVLQTNNMSLQEKFLIALYTPICLSLIWKWSKILLVVVNLEVISVFILSSVIMSGVVSSLLMTMVAFFVSEALILISSMFSSMRTSGLGFSLAMIW